MKVEADVQQEKKERSRESLTLVCDWSRGSQTFLMNCNTHSLMKTIKVVYENISFRVFSNNYAKEFLNQDLDHHWKNYPPTVSSRSKCSDFFQYMSS
jgi:hypothetical protein